MTSYVFKHVKELLGLVAQFDLKSINKTKSDGVLHKRCLTNLEVAFCTLQGTLCFNDRCYLFTIIHKYFTDVFILG